MIQPDYKTIYIDIINEEFPDKMSNQFIKDRLNYLDTVIDVLELNRLIFGEAEHEVQFKNQRLRSYDEKSIIEILEYQKKNNLTNVEVSNHFKTSRNTIAKWKTIFNI